MAQVTLKMLSKQTGLAVSTISEILNGKENYSSAETRAMVRRIAAEQGYRPNLGFRIMTGRDTGTAAIIFSQRRTWFVEFNMHLGMHLLEKLENSGRSAYTVVMSPHEAENIEKIREMISRGCRTFYFIGAPVGIKEIYALLDREKLERFSVNARYWETESDSETPGNNIFIDYSAVCRRFVGFYMDRGIRPVAVYSRAFFDQVGAAFRELADFSECNYFLETPDLGTIDGDCSQLAHDWAAERVAQECLRFPERTAYLCMSDHEAFGAYTALRAAGRPVGEGDISYLCGFGNSSLGRFLPINTTELHMERIAEKILAGIRGNEFLIPECIFRKPQGLFS